jgi:hypothetical protein
MKPINTLKAGILIRTTAPSCSKHKMNLTFTFIRRLCNNSLPTAGFIQTQMGWSTNTYRSCMSLCIRSKIKLPGFTLATSPRCNSMRFRRWSGVQMAIAAWRTERPRLRRQALFAQETRRLLTSRRWPNNSPCRQPWTLVRVKSDYFLAFWGMRFST